MTRHSRIPIEGAFAKAVAFLEGLGLRTRFDSDARGFLSGVGIRRGELVVVQPNDDLACELLHEAGHLAVLPGMFRDEASGDLDDVNKAMSDWTDQHLAAIHPDDPRMRAILQSGECEAVAWSYAAALAIGIDTRIPFYRGFDDEGLSLHDQVASGYYFGVHGLVAGGMTDLPRPHSTTPYPRMKRWLQV
jgi:hypothetical protein